MFTAFYLSCSSDGKKHHLVEGMDVGKEYKVWETVITEYELSEGINDEYLIPYLNFDRNRIASMPLPVKKILALYTFIGVSMEEMFGDSLAQSFGDFESLAQVRDTLLHDSDLTLPDESIYYCVKIIQTKEGIFVEADGRKDHFVISGTGEVCRLDS